MNLVQFNRDKCGVLHLGRQTSGCSAEKYLGLVSDSKLKRSQQCALAAERATSTLGCISKSPANDQRKRWPPHWPAPLGPHQGTASSFGSPSPRRTLINPSELSKTPPRQLGLKHLPCGERPREQGWSRDSFGSSPTTTYEEVIKKGSQAALSSTQWEDKTQKLKQERFSLDVQKSSSSVRPWSSLLLTCELVPLTAGVRTRELLSSLPTQIVLWPLELCPVETLVRQESSKTQA